MPNPLKAKVSAYNRERAADREKADDLMTLLAALPPGQVKNLLKDEACAAILHKYGVEEVGE
ncbi:MAG: hypothetical protein SOY30_15210 [Eubacteriales bacterium]|nr:hypothetical protein [Eubacteriales bacterium]